MIQYIRLWKKIFIIVLTMKKYVRTAILDIIVVTNRSNGGNRNGWAIVIWIRFKTYDKRIPRSSVGRKKPYKFAQYYPAQLKEVYGKSNNGWMNKVYWGDNLQIMSHMLRDYRGKIL